LKSLKGVFLDKFAHFLTMPAILISVSIYYSQFLSNNNAFFLITYISSFATFNPIKRIVTTISYQLATRNQYKQYEITEYFDNNKLKDLGFNDLLEDQNSGYKLRNNVQLFIINIGKQFFRHVSYLAFISFLLTLQYMNLNINILIIIWTLFLISIIMKEILFLYFVLRKNFIERNFLKLTNKLKQL